MESFSLLNEMLKRNSPLILIKNVTKLYPQAVFEIDSSGLLPLHHAIQNGISPNVIEHLLKLNKHAADAINKHGYAPLHYLFDEATVSAIDRNGYRKETYVLKVIELCCAVNPCAMLIEDMEERNVLECIIENGYKDRAVQKVQGLTKDAMRVMAL